MYSPCTTVCVITLLCRSYEQSVAEQSSDEKQLERVRSLYHRQLQLPNPQAAELLQEYETWEAKHGKVRDMWQHQQACGQLALSTCTIQSVDSAGRCHEQPAGCQNVNICVRWCRVSAALLPAVYILLAVYLYLLDVQ